MPDIEWRSVPGWEGFYEISNSGKVRSVARAVTRCDGVIQRYAARLKTPVIDKSGYDTVQLCNTSNGRLATFIVHRLVALAFIPNPCAKPFINHLDFNRRNNVVSNLEWVTLAENSRHSCKNGRQARGERHGQAKLTEAIVREARRKRANGVSYKRLAEIYGVTSPTMQYAIKHGWQHV